MVIPRVLDRFTEKYPGVVLHIDNVLSPAIDAAGLRDRKYDLILGRAPIPAIDDQRVADLNIESLFDDPLMLARIMHQL